MTAVNYVTDDQGEKKALIIDLEQLKKSAQPEFDLDEFLDDLDDMIAAELSAGMQGRPYNEVRKDILDGQ